MILFKDISKKYPGNRVALENINFRVEDGEFIFIVGPSGAGKTTLLRLLIAETLPSNGSIFIGDLEVNKLPSQKIPYLRRKIGFVFQDFKLIPDRTVAENIAVVLEILGKSPKDMEKKIGEIFEIVKLYDKDNYFPKQLSLGEQQRLAIGRAIAGEAKILLADEPTGNLDPRTSWEILRIINNINKLGATVIMATHNMDIVNSLKKRVITILNGKIIKDEKKSRYS